MSAQLMTPTDGHDDRLSELLAGETLGDLTPEETGELESLLADQSGVDRERFHEAAAALALLSPRETAPPHLASRLLDDLASTPLAGPAVFVEGSPSATDATPRPSLLALSGWLAAAAALAAAFVIAVVRPVSDPALSPERAYAAFLDRAPADLVTHDWVNVMAEGISGKVVWSDSEQRGFMLFNGLAANDPQTEQYQLWIFDAERPQETPVDGGVFDIADASVQTIVPIDAKIEVFDGQWFAITVEQPGGVVRSERENIPVVANMPTG